MIYSDSVLLAFVTMGIGAAVLISITLVAIADVLVPTNISA
jgi:hypothetical protein